MNRRVKLTDSLIGKLNPGDREYTVRDTLVPALGVRVHPSGGSSYVHFSNGTKASLGPTMHLTVQEARVPEPCTPDERTPPEGPGSSFPGFHCA